MKFTTSHRLASEEVTGSNPDIPYATGENGSPDSIKIPILWWVVHQASAGFVQLFVAGVNSFGEPTHRRAISLALDYAQLNDPQLQAELQLFDRDCYLPALAKLESGPPLQGSRPPEWRGDDFWFDTPGFYDDLEAERTELTVGHPVTTLIIEFGPHCNEWWRGADLGLESRLYSYIERTTGIGSSNTDMEGVGIPLPDEPKEKSRAVRAFLKKSPPDILGNMTGGDSAPGNKGNPIAPSSWLGKAGILIGYAIAKTATYHHNDWSANGSGDCACVRLHCSSYRRTVRNAATGTTGILHFRFVQPEISDGPVGSVEVH